MTSRGTSGVRFFLAAMPGWYIRREEEVGKGV